MAKWGEGDPRWLVEERPDATNVNNWHWAEKNASHWSKAKFSDLFVGKKIETDFASCKITELTKSDGDAMVHNRKAKLFFFYEWVLEMKWEGSLIDGDITEKGTIVIPNFSEEHDVKEVDVDIALDSPGSEEGVVLKDMMRSMGCEVIRQCMSDYLTMLREEFSKGLILPTKDRVEVNDAKDCKRVQRNQGEVEKTSTQSKALFETCELRTSETFKCTAEEFYRALTVKELVQAFTQGNCILEARAGGKFELFDGNVQGVFVSLVPNKEIKQKWRFKAWPSGHFSSITIDINQKADCTEVNILQKDIPKTELENTRNGWKRFYWDSMKRTFGFGAMLY